MKQKLIVGLALLNGGGLVVLAMAFWLMWWPLELLVSFTPLLLILSGVYGLLFLTLFRRPRPRRWHPWHRRSTWAILISVLVASYCLLYSLQVQKPARLQVGSDQTMRFTTYNRLYRNPDDQRAAQYFRDQAVDLVLMQEAGAGQVAAMGRLLDFPHHHSVNNPWGDVGIVSRWPLHNAREVLLDGRRSALRVELDTPAGKRLAVYVVHIPPPFSPGSYGRSRQQFKQLMKLIQADRLPVVVGGDFNTTIFSPKLRNFNTAVNNKVMPTTITPWPACSWYGFGLPFCLRIDHFYLPRSAQLRATHVAPALGSDHRAVMVEFSF